MSTNSLYGKQEYKGTGSSFSTADCEKLVYLKHNGVGLEEAYKQNRISFDQYKRFVMSGRAIVEQLKKNDPVGTKYEIWGESPVEAYEKIKKTKHNEVAEAEKNTSMYVAKLNKIEADISNLLYKFEEQYCIESRNKYMLDLFAYVQPQRKYQKNNDRKKSDTLNMVEWIENVYKGKSDGSQYFYEDRVRKLEMRVKAYKGIVAKLGKEVNKEYMDTYFTQQKQKYSVGNLKEQDMTEENVEQQSNNEVLEQVNKWGDQVANYIKDRYTATEEAVQAAYAVARRGYRRRFLSQ